MGDLDFKLSSAGEKDSTHSNLSNESLDLKITNGTLEKVEKAENNLPKTLGEEYFQSLFDLEKSETAEEILQEITSEIPENDELSEDVFQNLQNETVSDLAEEIMQEITSDIPENDELSEETPTDLTNEKEIIMSANEILPSESATDNVLTGLSQTTLKDKYDFLNLCVLAVVILLLGMTFIFAKNSTSGNDSVKFSLSTVKTGEYTQYLGEQYTEKMPLEKTMTQANVFLRKIFGKTDLEFVVFKDTEPPNGPVDNNNLGGMSANDGFSENETTTTSATQSVTLQTTTPKFVQGFELSTPEETDETDKVFTGRPIKTTTSKVTTTIKLPETTDETTTGKVNLILP